MYNLSLKQLKTIFILGETKRLVQAAEILSLTPPAVTIQLKLAEEQIGLKLFSFDLIFRCIFILISF